MTELNVFLLLILFAPGVPDKVELRGPYFSRTLCLLVFEMRRDLWWEKHPEDGAGVRAKCGTADELGNRKV